MRNKSLTNQKAYNPPKLFNMCLSRAILLPPLKPLQVINERLFFLFQLHANAVNVRAKEEKDQFCKRKWLILCLNSSACDTNTRPVQKLCPSVNGTLLLQLSDLGYIAQMEKYAGPPFGRWHPVTEAEICIPEIDTQHLDHMQPGNLK